MALGVLLGVGMSGCGMGETGCGGVSCDSTISLGFETLGVEAHEVFFEVVRADGTRMYGCEAGPSMEGVERPVHCTADGVLIAGRGEGDAFDDLQLVRVLSRSDGAIIMEYAEDSFTRRRYRPNGRRCGPVCTVLEPL